MSEHIDRAVAELKRAIDNNPGATVFVGHSQYEGDIRDVIKDMVFDTCCCDDEHTLQPCGPCRCEDHDQCAHR